MFTWLADLRLLQFYRLVANSSKVAKLTNQICTRPNFNLSNDWYHAVNQPEIERERTRGWATKHASLCSMHICARFPHLVPPPSGCSLPVVWTILILVTFYEVCRGSCIVQDEFYVAECFVVSSPDPLGMRQCSMCVSQLRDGWSKYVEQRHYSASIS